MVYLRKILSDNTIIKYESGVNGKDYIGTIEFRVDVPINTPFQNRNPKLSYYKNFSFCGVTASALQGIAKFIRENNYPDKYLRATH